MMASIRQYLSISRASIAVSFVAEPNPRSSVAFRPAARRALKSTLARGYYKLYDVRVHLTGSRLIDSTLKLMLPYSPVGVRLKGKSLRRLVSIHHNPCPGILLPATVSVTLGVATALGGGRRAQQAAAAASTAVGRPYVEAKIFLVASFELPAVWQHCDIERVLSESRASKAKSRPEGRLLWGTAGRSLRAANRLVRVRRWVSRSTGSCVDC
jgi:hypothetical protein